MKKLHFIALSIIGLVSTPLIADEFTACKSNLTKQMKRFEKIKFSVPRKIPTGNLREYALQMEILCPWQVEIDLNSDKKTDWVGIIYRQDKYELIAYISSDKKHEVQVLHSYNFFPEQTYLKLTRKKAEQQKNRSRRNFIYDVAEITLNDSSRVYSLDNNKFKVIRQYQDVTILNNQSNDDFIDEENID